MPSPMTLMFQKIPVSLCCYFTSLRFNPYAQAPEWGGDEEQHQVIATVETATFVVAALCSNLDQRYKTRSFSPVRHQDGDKNYNKTKPTQGATSQWTDHCPVQAVEEPHNHVPDAGP